MVASLVRAERHFLVEPVLTDLVAWYELLEAIRLRGAAAFLAKICQIDTESCPREKIPNRIVVVKKMIAI